VNEFVDECRSEWKRLGVPDPIADEMAAELAADLDEAEADGASPEEVLGALDARAFAAAWAGERGVVHQPPSGSPRRLRTVLTAAVTVAFAVSAIAGALLMILASPFPSRSAAPPVWVRPLPGSVWVRPLPAHGSVTVLVDAQGETHSVLAVQDRSITLRPAPGSPRVVVADDDSGFDTETLGSVLLIAGLAGLVPLTLYWLWAGSRRRAPAY
jgi:hypothetical protein